MASLLALLLRVFSMGIRQFFHKTFLEDLETHTCSAQVRLLVTLPPAMLK
jgi:hypothetical protein